MPDSSGHFAIGGRTGAALCALAMLGGVPAEPPVDSQAAWRWIDHNLGASLWLFGLVTVLWALDLGRLQARLRRPEQMALKDIVGLDQRLDVWSQLFIGIGVVWTAIGMRSALQAALGDGAAEGSAASVLQRLVEGGILLALTTTIVGGVGGYLMRLAKTMLVGAPLQAFYEALDQAGVRALLGATERIEAQLRTLNQPPRELQP